MVRVYYGGITTMTFTDAAAEVLRLVGKPLHYKEITAVAIEKNLLSHVGKSPEVTMGARLAALFKKAGEDISMVRVKPGVFALKEWEQSGQLKQMVAKGKEGKGQKGAAHAQQPAAPAPEAQPVLPLPEPVAQAPAAEQPKQARPAPRAEQPKPAPRAEPQKPAPRAEQAKPAEAVAVTPAVDRTASPEPDEDDESAAPVSPEEVERADLAAQAAGVFEEEDDDDQPILGSDAPADREGSRRRRRRRRRGKSGQEGNGSLPSYTVSPASAEATHDEEIQPEPRQAAPAPAAPHPVVLDVAPPSLDSIALDDLAGRDMAEAIATVLGAFDRSAGPVSLRQIAEAAQRKARLSGDIQQVQSQIAAAVRADNYRRNAAGQRPRFRFTAGRIGLTDWLLTSELVRLEQDAIAAVDRYREASRKALQRKLQELPGHAFIEIALLAMERMGLTQVRAVRRAGIPGNEAHFAAVQRTGPLEMTTAVVIRRDGREIGRERVSELRGSLHHYGPANVGWLITSGQVLSGAREEASATSNFPIALLDGYGVAKLCERYEVAVVQSRLPIAIPDVDMLDALRSS